MRQKSWAITWGAVRNETVQLFPSRNLIASASVGLLSLLLVGCVHDPASSLRQPGDPVRGGTAPTVARDQLRPYCPQNGAWIERNRTDTGAALGRITFLGEDPDRAGFCRFHFGQNRNVNFLSVGPIPILPDEVDAAGPALANLFPLRVGNTASYSFVARHFRGADTSSYRITYTVLREESLFHNGAHRNVFVVARSAEGQFNNISRVQDVYRIDRQTLLPLSYQQIIERGVGDPQAAWNARLSSGQPAATPAHNALTDMELGTIARHIQTCWSVALPAALQDIVVELRVETDSAGNVRGVRPNGDMPAEPRARAVYESARRALLSPSCSPIPVARERLHLLGNVVLRFSPRGLER